ncbi:MAG: helix-turn-helix domain-containing protein [Clostridia bacterium]|nr:helix-turn-helix domain-containing protein [Clostridia bacterium]
MGNVVGENLKRIRKERGLTQEDLAKIIGYSSQQAIARLENADRAPRYEIAVKIAEKLEIDVFELLADVKTQKKITSKIHRNVPAFLFPKEAAAAEEMAKQSYVDGFKDGQLEGKLIACFRALNDNGKNEALKRIYELTEINRYTNKPEETP